MTIGQSQTTDVADISGQTIAPASITSLNSLAFATTGSTIAANGPLLISTAAAATSATANIAVNSSGQTTFTPNLSSFTVSSALSGTFTNTTLTTCVSTITLSLPTGNSIIFVGFNGTISVNSLAAVIGIGVLVDGAYVNGETSAKGLTAPQEAVSTDGTNLSFNTLLTGLSAGSHNVCLVPFVSGGTGTIDSTNSVAKFWMYALP